MCQRNNLNVKVKSFLFLFVASYCLQIFFFLNIAPIFFLLLFVSAVLLQWKFHKAKIFLFLSVVFAWHALKMYMYSWERCGGGGQGWKEHENAAFLIFALCVLSIPNPKEVQVSKAKKKKIGRKNLFIVMHFLSFLSHLLAFLFRSFFPSLKIPRSKLHLILYAQKILICGSEYFG